MATLTLNFTNASPAPANGYRVKYRLKGTSDVYTTLSPSPSASPAIITGINEANNYEGTIESDCGGGLFSSVATFSTCTCPSGYSRNPENTGCFIVDTVAATPPTGGVAKTTQAVTNAAYTTCGTYIYSPGYNVNGTGTSTQVSLSNGFWKNGAGGCVDSTTTEGPLNRSGLWVINTNPSDADNQRIGFSVCLDLDETTTYYIGIAGDNLPTIKIDGVTIINMDTTAMIGQYGGNAAVTFKIWHVYPITLSSGPHNVELTCMNITSVASLGAEVYKLTSSALAAKTSYADFATGELVFSTKDFRGMQAQLGSGGSGYSCPSGYALSTCGAGTPVCNRITTANCS